MLKENDVLCDTSDYLYVTLHLNAISDSQVTPFRDQHNVAKIKEVDILFLTGTFSIDISAKSIIY